MIKKKKKKQAQKRKNPSTQLKILHQNQISITSEAKYIIERAQGCDSRVVKMGNLVFFSTQTGDAWLLDSEDKLALCLARGGSHQSYKILEADSNFGIERKAHYHIDEDVFAVIESSGSTRAIYGYPTKKIEEVIQMGE